MNFDWVTFVLIPSQNPPVKLLLSPQAIVWSAELTVWLPLKSEPMNIPVSFGPSSLASKQIKLS